MSNYGVSRRTALRIAGAASLGVIATETMAPAAVAAQGEIASLPGHLPAQLPLVSSATRKLAPAVGLDLEIPNGGFEVAVANGTPAEWDVIGGNPENIATVDAAHAHGGGHSLKLDHGSAAALYVRSMRLPVNAGDDIAVSLWVLGESGTPGTLYLEFRNANDTRVSEVHVTPEFSTEWQEISLTATAPAGTVSIDVLIYGSASKTGASYFDDVVVLNLSIPPYVSELGSEAELLIDNYRVAALANLERVVHTGRKSGILLRPDQPWEGTMVYLYGGAIWDPSLHRYRMWYTAIDPNLGISICYAESKDGLRWDKPDLHLVAYQGSTANNIVLSAAAGSGCYGVIYDPDDGDPSRRYKMMAYIRELLGYCVYFSPDGLSWTASSANPVIPDGDVASVSHDRANNRFIATSKHPYGKRVAFVSTSTDFVNWSERTLALEADDRDKAFALAHGASDSQVYGMPAFPYGNAYLALPWMFELAGRGEPGTAGDGLIEVQIATSRDLIRWERPARTPIIGVGVGGSWDQGMIFTANTPIVTDDEVIMYYGAWDGPHGTKKRGCSIGRAVWDRDRFVSLTNGGDLEGSLTTKPLQLAGSTLTVNVETTPKGHLYVEALDPATGAVIDGYSRADCKLVKGDRNDARIEWGGKDLTALRDREIALRFSLLDGRLYSFRTH